MPTKPHRSDRKELRARLEARRRDLAGEIHRRITQMREGGSTVTMVKEPDDTDPGDLEVKVLEIAAGTLRGIDQAIARLSEGRYGRCIRCCGRIAEARLRALPFATCCRQCEIVRERETARATQAAGRGAWGRELLDEQPTRDDR